jgi:hypothetical protein
MAKTVKAQAGDSLCNIAFVNGFGDCTKLRAEPKNAFIVNRAVNPGQVLPGDVVTLPELVDKDVNAGTEAKHKFVKHGDLAIVRFVHGSASATVKNDRTLRFLNVSNYQTDKAGAPDGNVAFPGPGVRNFNADADKDIDAFKVEVLDVNGAGELTVELEVLRPVYSATGSVTGHTEFPAAIRAGRQLKPKASKQGSTTRFRTSYLRLVVDPVDKAAANDQTLLASDMFDPADATTKRVEILDQIVRATYEIPSCKQNPKCRSTVTVPIGRDRRRIRLAVHVLNNQPAASGGTPIVALADVEKRVFTWFRRVYAQANIAPKLTLLRAIDPPENLIAISDDHGAKALGTETLGFRINSTGKPSINVGPYTPKKGDTPLQTARALAKLITAPYSAAVSENAARLDAASDNTKSCDIVITEATGARVTIANVVTPAGGHGLTVGRVNPANVPRAPFNFSGLIGTVEQRALFKNFDTGDDRVDVFVVQNIIPAGVRGTATLSGHRTNIKRRAVSRVKCSVLMAQRAIDSSDKLPFTFPHEFGHVAGECGHANGAPTQLMKSGTSETNVIDGSKRVRDSAVTYDDGTFNLIDRIRAESPGLLEGWG